MKLRNLLFFSLLSFTTIYSGNAQEYLLEVENAVDSIEPGRGKNRAKYHHVYVGYGFILGPSDDGAKTTPLATREWLLGIRYKRKLSNVFALGYDLSYKSTSFRLVQDSAKKLPNNLLNDRERMIFHNATLGLYFRINSTSKRGDKLGKYVDLGVYGDYVFAHVLFQRNELPSGIVSRQRTHNHSYFNNLNYGVNFRLGGDRLVWYSSYRLSDMFFPSLQYPEMSRISVGIQLNLN